MNNANVINTMKDATKRKTKRLLRKNWHLFWLTLILIAFGCAGNAARNIEQPVELTIMTEEYAPLNFTVDGEITGQATEVVRELIRRTGTQANIRVVDWDDGLKEVMEKPNTALYSTAMTRERKDHLQWVGPITVLESNFYGLKSSEISIGTLDDAKKVPMIATVVDYYTEQVLKEEGFDNLKSHATEEQALRTLLSGEAQLFVSNNTVMPSLIESIGAPLSAVKKVFTISTDMSYIAFSPDTKTEIVDNWQKQLNAMKRNDSFDEIYKKWFPTETPPGILHLVTEEYPPVTFMKDSKPSGLVTDMVYEITSRLDIPDKITLTSWKNAYNMAQIHPNVIIFSMDRTEAREDLFHWIGPVGQNSAIFYTRKGSDITIGSMEEAKQVSSIATTTEWWTEQLLNREGFTNLVSSQDSADNVKQLMSGEVELSIFTDITIPEIVKNAGYSMDDLQPVFTVQQNYFYIGMSKGTSPEIVEQWQEVLSEMKQDGTFAEIYRTYLPRADINNLMSTQ
jgi:polar amino acid transport system substrate-binding protein